MVTPYLCIIRVGGRPGAGDAAAIGRHTSLQVEFGAPGLQLFATSRRDILDLGYGRGVIVGTFFPRHGPSSRIETLDRPATDRLIADVGQTIWDRYWGAYISIVRHGDRLLVARDPSGALPCYYADSEVGIILASSPRILIETGLVATSLDFTQIAWQQWSMSLPSTLTALDGVRELAPGAVLTVEARGIEQQTRWSPWNHVAPRPNWTMEDGADRLFRTVDQCVSAWSSCFDTVLLGLSGGLDSSIVAACLSRTTSRATMLNMVTASMRGDERIFARAVAEHLSLPLEERFYDPDDVTVTNSSVAHLARPSGRTSELAYDAAVERLGRETGAEALFTGNAGDNVFYKTRSARAIVDRLRVEGALRIWPTLIAVCRLTECTLGQVLRETVRAKRRGAAYRWSTNGDFLSADVVAHLASEPPSHPWLDCPDGALPGKAAQIAAILRVQPHLEGAVEPGALPVINPLASQPLVELCLTIPTWWMVEGGRDRSLVRTAFSAALPEMVIDRRSKGGPDGFAVDLLRSNLEIVRERLLDGRLASQGLLDRPALEAALDANKLGIDLSYVRLLGLLDCEAWTETWSDRLQRSGAAASVLAT